MNPIRLIKDKICPWRAKKVRKPLRGSTTLGSRDIPLNEYFDRSLPEEFWGHQHYFAGNGRSPGKDAFHTMWFTLFHEFYPSVVSIARLPETSQLAREINKKKCTGILGEGYDRVFRDFGI